MCIDKIRFSKAVPILLALALGLLATGAVALGDDGTITVWGGQRFLVLTFRVANDNDDDKSLSSVTLKNSVDDPDVHLDGVYVAKIELVDRDSGKVIGSTTDASDWDDGVEITTNLTVPAYARRYVEVWITLKESTIDLPLPPDYKIKMDISASKPADLTIDEKEAPEFSVGTQDGLATAPSQDVSGGSVYGGQRVLVSQFHLADGPDDNPYDVTVTAMQLFYDEFYETIYPSMLKLHQNSSSRLASKYIEKIEIVRADTGKVVATATELSGLDSAPGIVVRFSQGVVVPDDGGVTFEIWVTLAAEVPTGRVFSISAEIYHEEGGIRFPPGPNPGNAIHVIVRGNDFTTGAPGLETCTNDSTGVAGTAFAGTKALVQKITLGDSDDDPYDVQLNSVVVVNVAASPLAGKYISGVEVYSEGFLLGKVTDKASLAGFDKSGVGVRVPLNKTNGTIPDDVTGRKLEIYVTIGEYVPAGRHIKLSTIIWAEEGGIAFKCDDSIEGQDITVKTPLGLKAEDATSSKSKTIYSGATALVQVLKLSPREENDPSDYTLTEIVVKNASTSSPVKASDIEKIKVKAEDGTTLGETTDIDGFNGDGVRVDLDHEIAAGAFPVKIKVYVKLSSGAKGGRKLRLSSSIKSETDGYRSWTGFVQSSVEFETEIDRPHQVSFTVSPIKPKCKEKVTFTPSVHDDPKDPKGRDRVVYSKWDFGDGKTSDRKGPPPPQGVSHTYSKSGDYKVTLMVRDDKGVEASYTKTITVSSSKPTGVDFSWSPESPKWNDTIVFKPKDGIKDPDGDIKKAIFKWNFGDGTTYQTTGSQQVSHRYGKGGEFKVTLTVVDECGTSESKEHKVSLTNERPTGVDFSWTPQAPWVGGTVTFVPSPEIEDPDGDIDKATFKWDFGDGATKETIGPSPVDHEFGQSGSFPVTLKIVDEGGAESQEQGYTVKVSKVGFSWSPDSPVAGEKVTFTAYPQKGTYTYKWDFGDGSSDRGNPVEHVYKTPSGENQYTVKLTVLDSKGAVYGVATNKVTVGSSVNDPPEVTALAVDPTSPQAGEEVSFTATTEDPENDEVTDWEWDFDGDGTVDATTNADTATHTYDEPGFYRVRVRAKDSGGSGKFGPWYEKKIYVRGTGAAAIGVELAENPVDQEARLAFFVPEGATDIRLRVYDLAGRLVYESDRPAGDEFRWNLADEAGQLVPDGLYFAIITATLDGKSIRSQIVKILVLR